MNISNQNGESVVAVNNQVIRIGKKHILINDKKVTYENGNPVIKGKHLGFAHLFTFFVLGMFFGMLFSGFIFLG